MHMRFFSQKSCAKNDGMRNKQDHCHASNHHGVPGFSCARHTSRYKNPIIFVSYYLASEGEKKLTKIAPFFF